MTSPALAAASSTSLFTEDTVHVTCKSMAGSLTVTVPHVADSEAPVVALLAAKVIVKVPASG
jgi:hypothetical protein